MTNCRNETGQAGKNDFEKTGGIKIILLRLQDRNHRLW